MPSQRHGACSYPVPHCPSGPADALLADYYLHRVARMELIAAELRLLYRSNTRLDG